MDDKVIRLLKEISTKLDVINMKLNDIQAIENNYKIDDDSSNELHDTFELLKDII